MRNWLCLLEGKVNYGSIQTVGWYVAIIENPNENPEFWKINYIKGPETFGVIVGSSAVLKDSSFVYAFGVEGRGTHETYLLRFKKDSWPMEIYRECNGGLIIPGRKNVSEEPKSVQIILSGQTEFSVTSR